LDLAQKEIVYEFTMRQVAEIVAIKTLR